MVFGYESTVSSMKRVAEESILYPNTSNSYDREDLLLGHRELCSIVAFTP